MSRSSARAGMRGSPGAETPISGHGFGLLWQNCIKSCARFCGRMARLACTKPAARPDVGPSCLLRRIASRAARPGESVCGFPRRIADVAMISSSCVPAAFRREVLPTLASSGRRKRPFAATILHAETPYPARQTNANSVETGIDIAFAKDLIFPARSLQKAGCYGAVRQIQRRTTDERELETRGMGARHLVPRQAHAPPRYRMGRRCDRRHD